MFLVPPKYVSRAKTEFKDLVPIELDRGMWQACRTINLIEDVATLWSSAGNPDAEDPRCYVTLIASSSTGVRNIEMLYRNWCHLLGTHLPEKVGSLPIYHFTELTLNRSKDPYATTDEVIWTRHLTTIPDTEYNTPLKVTNYLQLAATRLVI